MSRQGFLSRDASPTRGSKRSLVVEIHRLKDLNFALPAGSSSPVRGRPTTPSSPAYSQAIKTELHVGLGTVSTVVAIDSRDASETAKSPSKTAHVSGKPIHVGGSAMGGIAMGGNAGAKDGNVVVGGTAMPGNAMPDRFTDRSMDRSVDRFRVAPEDTRKILPYNGEQLVRLMLVNGPIQMGFADVRVDDETVGETAWHGTVDLRNGAESACVASVEISLFKAGIKVQPGIQPPPETLSPHSLLPPTSSTIPHPSPQEGISHEMVTVGGGVNVGGVSGPAGNGVHPKPLKPDYQSCRVTLSSFEFSRDASGKAASPAKGKDSKKIYAVLTRATTGSAPTQSLRVNDAFYDEGCAYFNQVAVFPVAPENPEAGDVRVEIYEDKKLARDPKIGSCRLSLADVLSNKTSNDQRLAVSTLDSSSAEAAKKGEKTGEKSGKKTVVGTLGLNVFFSDERVAAKGAVKELYSSSSEDEGRLKAERAQVPAGTTFEPLRLEVTEAKKLPEDAYLVCRVGKKKARCDKVVRDAKFTLPYAGQRFATLRLYRNKKLAKDPCLGTRKIDLYDLQSQNHQSQSQQSQTHKGVKAVKVTLMGAVGECTVSMMGGDVQGRSVTETRSSTVAVGAASALSALGGAVVAFDLKKATHITAPYKGQLKPYVECRLDKEMLTTHSSEDVLLETGKATAFFRETFVYPTKSTKDSFVYEFKLYNNVSLARDPVLGVASITHADLLALMKSQPANAANRTALNLKMKPAPTSPTSRAETTTTAVLEMEVALVHHMANLTRAQVLESKNFNSKNFSASEINATPSLHVLVERVNGLVNPKAKLDTLDPYVTLAHGDHKAKTKVLKDAGSDAEFEGELFVVPMASDAHTLQLQVYDAAHLARDPLLGSASIPSDLFFASARATRHVLPLKGKAGAAAGSVTVVLRPCTKAVETIEKDQKIGNLETITREAGPLPSVGVTNANTTKVGGSAAASVEGGAVLEDGNRRPGNRKSGRSVSSSSSSSSGRRGREVRERSATGATVDAAAHSHRALKPVTDSQAGNRRVRDSSSSSSGSDGDVRRGVVTGGGTGSPGTNQDGGYRGGMENSYNVDYNVGGGPGYKVISAAEKDSMKRELGAGTGSTTSAFGALRVSVKKAEGLKFHSSKKMIDTIDAYVIVSAGEFVKKSPVLKDSGSDPVFDFCENVRVDDYRYLKISAYDSARLGSDTFLGSAHVDLTELSEQQRFGQEMSATLLNKKDKESGKIFFKVDAIELNAETRDAAFIHPEYRTLRCHVQSLSGLRTAEHTTSLSPHARDTLDPYLVASLGTSSLEGAVHTDAGSNVTTNETFVFPLLSPSLHLEVFDNVHLGKDALLGTATVNLAGNLDLLESGQLFQVQLEDKEGLPAGFVELMLRASSEPCAKSHVLSVASRDAGSDSDSDSDSDSNSDAEEALRKAQESQARDRMASISKSVKRLDHSIYKSFEICVVNTVNLKQALAASTMSNKANKAKQEKNAQPKKCMIYVSCELGSSKVETARVAVEGAEDPAFSSTVRFPYEEDTAEVLHVKVKKDVKLARDKTVAVAAIPLIQILNSGLTTFTCVLERKGTSPHNDAASPASQYEPMLLLLTVRPLTTALKTAQLVKPSVHPVTSLPAFKDVRIFQLRLNAPNFEASEMLKTLRRPYLLLSFNGYSARSSILHFNDPSTTPSERRNGFPQSQGQGHSTASFNVPETFMFSLTSGCGSAVGSFQLFEDLTSMDGSAASGASVVEHSDRLCGAFEHDFALTAQSLSDGETTHFAGHLIRPQSADRSTDRHQSAMMHCVARLEGAFMANSAGVLREDRQVLVTRNAIFLPAVSHKSRKQQESRGTVRVRIEDCVCKAVNEEAGRPYAMLEYGGHSLRVPIQSDAARSPAGRADGAVSPAVQHEAHFPFVAGQALEVNFYDDVKFKRDPLLAQAHASVKSAGAVTVPILGVNSNTAIGSLKLSFETRDETLARAQVVPLPTTVTVHATAMGDVARGDTGMGAAALLNGGAGRGELKHFQLEVYQVHMNAQFEKAVEKPYLCVKYAGHEVSLPDACKDGALETCEGQLFESLSSTSLPGPLELRLMNDKAMRIDPVVALGMVDQTTMTRLQEKAVNSSTKTLSNASTLDAFHLPFTCTLLEEKTRKEVGIVYGNLSLTAPRESRLKSLSKLQRTTVDRSHALSDYAAASGGNDGAFASYKSLLVAPVRVSMEDPGKAALVNKNPYVDLQVGSASSLRCYVSSIDSKAESWSAQLVYSGQRYMRVVLADDLKMKKDPVIATGFFDLDLLFAAGADAVTGSLTKVREVSVLLRRNSPDSANVAQDAIFVCRVAFSSDSVKVNKINTSLRLSAHALSPQHQHQHSTQGQGLSGEGLGSSEFATAETTVGSPQSTYGLSPASTSNAGSPRQGLSSPSTAPRALGFWDTPIAANDMSRLTEKDIKAVRVEVVHGNDFPLGDSTSDSGRHISLATVFGGYELQGSPIATDSRDGGERGLSARIVFSQNFLYPYRGCKSFKFILRRSDANGHQKTTIGSAKIDLDHFIHKSKTSTHKIKIPLRNADSEPAGTINCKLSFAADSGPAEPVFSTINV